MTEQPRDHFVYRTFDADGRLLYVGCTRRLGKRWSEHKLERGRMVAATARCRLQGPYTRDKARAIEREAIRTESPLVNWTPEVRHQDRKRQRWIDARIGVLFSAGVPLAHGLRQACEEADEFLPDLRIVWRGA